MNPVAWLKELHVVESPSSRVKGSPYPVGHSPWHPWLEENKSSLPLARCLIYHDLHHKPLRSLKWVRMYAMVCNGMMSCYAWGDVGKPCYESQLRTINRPCKKFSILCYESQLRTINKTCKRFSKPCYESRLRTVNKTCKKLTCQITSMQVVKF